MVIALMVSVGAAFGCDLIGASSLHGSGRCATATGESVRSVTARFTNSRPRSTCAFAGSWSGARSVVSVEPAAPKASGKPVERTHGVTGW